MFLVPLLCALLLGIATAQPGSAPGATMELGDLPTGAYTPTEVAGFSVLVHPDAQADLDLFLRTRAALTWDLELAARLVPAEALAVLRETPILLTPSMRARGGWDPRCAAFHESAGWLTANGLDGAREGTIEIFSFANYTTWRCEQPMMLLHEMAHAYHWRLGFDRADVRGAFDAARGAGLYKGVSRATLADGRTTDAYALTNEKEYFAELSEAYFGRNDFAPFTRDELRAYDPAGFAVVEHLWNLSGQEIALERVAPAPAAEPAAAEDPDE